MQAFLEERVIVLRADITTLKADAIVNAANSSLMGGGGVDGAIHRAGGKEILEACKEIRRTKYPGGLPTGHAVATPAGNLHARYVIHTVGPVWKGGRYQEDALLVSAYRESFLLAKGLKCKSIAFPAISTGVYGFPFDRAIPLVCSVVKEFVDSFEKIFLVFYSTKDYKDFLEGQTFRK